MIYAGCNNRLNGTPFTKTEKKTAVETLQNKGCKVSVYLIAPRLNTKDLPLNQVLRNISYFHNLNCIVYIDFACNDILVMDVGRTLKGTDLG